MKRFSPKMYNLFQNNQNYKIKNKRAMVVLNRSPSHSPSLNPGELQINLDFKDIKILSNFQSQYLLNNNEQQTETVKIKLVNNQFKNNIH